MVGPKQIYPAGRITAEEAELRGSESFINGITMPAFFPEGGAVSIFQGDIFKHP